MKWVEHLFAPVLMITMIGFLSGCETLDNTQTWQIGPTFRQFDNLPSDRALVYVYRSNINPTPGEWFTGTGNAADVGFPFPVSVNGTPVATLVKGGYFVYLAEAGRIQFTASTESTGLFSPPSQSSIIVNAVAGQSFYVKGVYNRGLGGGAHLELVVPDVGEKEIPSCHLTGIFPVPGDRSRVKPAGHVVSAETHEDIPAQLKKLKELKDAGILTDEEYETHRKALVAKLGQ